MIKKVIYTVDVGNYDIIKPLDGKYSKGWDCFLLTDNEKLKVKGWETIVLNKRDFNDLPNVAISRHPKILPHLYFEEYDYFLYIDGNRYIGNNLNKFFEKFGHNKFMTLQNTQKEFIDLYREIEACKEKGRRKYLDSLRDKLELQKQDYIREGLPINLGYRVDNSVLFRHNNKEVNEFNGLWWEEYIKRKTWRDQLAIRYLLWKYNFKINIEDHYSLSNKYQKNKKVNAFFIKNAKHRGL